MKEGEGMIKEDIDDVRAVLSHISDHLENENIELAIALIEHCCRTHSKKMCKIIRFIVENNV